MRLSTPPFEPVDATGTDLLDSSYYATGDPHALWAYLRENEPVHQQKPEGREPFWVVTKYADVCRVLKNYSEFSSRRGTMLCIIDLSMPDIASDQMLPDTDPPRHTLIREPLNRALTPKAVNNQQERIRQIVNDLIAPALEGEVFDIASAALMFPMAFTGSLMGIPEEAWPRMSHLATMTVAYDDPEFAEGSPKATLRQAHHELFGLFAEEIARRPATDPGDDLIGILMSMELDGTRLSEEQVLLNCYSLMLGANVTTPHVISTLVKMLAEDPERYRCLEDSPELRKTCVEESLRWASPASHFMRYASRDIELRGKKIREGEAVTAWLGSANRDEDAFPDPFRFDISRRPNRHVAFGVGPHYCIGSGLARLALRVFLDELVCRIQAIELAGPEEHLASNFVAGFKHMPVRMEPRRQVAGDSTTKLGHAEVE